MAPMQCLPNCSILHSTLIMQSGVSQCWKGGLKSNYLQRVRYAILSVKGHKAW
uniref:Uncharacterized protein n=1 Tax=Anguilla anguilla TaxID=7936 RepID=A0A0E9W9K7_ANGAN